MLGVKEWQEKELDHCRLPHDQAAREREGWRETDGPENKKDLNSPVLTAVL